MTNSKGFIIFLLLISFFAIHSHAKNLITFGNTFSKNCVSKQIMQSSHTIYKARIIINNINCEEEQINGTEYIRLKLDDESFTLAEGEPLLPVIIQHIGMSPGASYKIDIEEHEWTDVPIGRIIPAQSPFITEPTIEEFVISDSTYESESYIPTFLSLSETQRWKGIDNFYVKICPFRYYPRKETISVLRDFTITILFENTDNKIESPLPGPSELKIFDNPSFLNPITPKTSGQLNSIDSCDYLIIVGDIPEIVNSQSMKDFRKWKALKGFQTRVVSTATIGNDSASIKNYIAQMWQIGVRRVLFVGGNDKIPLVTLESHHKSQFEYLKSDYWYGCLQGDNDIQAEIPIGRFITNTLDEFSNMVNKTIKYESLNHIWTNRNLLVSHSQTSYFQNILEEISSRSYSNPLLFYKAYGASVSQGGLGSDKYDVLNYINDGMNIVTINCHGNAGCFWMFDGENSTVSYYDEDTLNYDTYPVIFSNACYNGDFTIPHQSIAKRFSCSDHCSTAYTGCTVPSFIYPANSYLRKLYTNLLDSCITNLGDLILLSQVMNLGYGDTAIDNALSYICSGDPSLELWTGEQNTFEGVNISLANDSIIISVGNTEQFTVNLSDENGNLLGRYASSNTNVRIPLLTVNFDLAVNKHNYIPHVVHFNTRDNYIQDTIFTDNVIYLRTPLEIGNDVTTSKPNGDVILQPGANIFISKGNGITIKNGFECKIGASFTVE